MDGHGSGSPVWPGAAKLICDHEQPGICTLETVLQGGGGCAADGLRPVASDVSSAHADFTDAGGGG